ncbi:hypothetical protein, partial [Bartonella grahamii]|uniref:hypothetical protein n=1 Tax=Bartonella grahamii TaxID=33045 RepID=UPI001ABADDBA
ELENSGQLAAGHDLAFSVKDNATNSKTGLIYVKGNGALQVDGALHNDFGAIVAEGDLSFTNAEGTGKSLSLVNKAGLIQAGGNLNIQTNSLKNEADSTPVITQTSENVTISFKKPDKYNFLDARDLYHDTRSNNWGKGKLSKWPFGSDKKNFIFEQQVWASKDETYGTAILDDGTVYKSFTWKYNDNRKG